MKLKDLMMQLRVIEGDPELTVSFEYVQDTGNGTLSRSLKVLRLRQQPEGTGNLVFTLTDCQSAEQLKRRLAEESVSAKMPIKNG